MAGAPAGLEDQMSKRRGKAPFEAGSRTSESAANNLLDVSAKEQLVMTELFNIAPDGMTDKQLQAVTGLLHESVSARRRELVLKGRVRNSGEIRLNVDTNRKAIIWVIGKEKEIVLGKPSPRSRRPSRKDFSLASSELHTVFQRRKKKPSSELEKVILWLGMLSASDGAGS